MSKTMSKLEETMSVEIVREGNTYYAFADSGEMIASGPGRKSCFYSLGAALQRRGLGQVYMAGRLWEPASLLQL